MSLPSALRLRFVRAPDDASFSDPDYQAELRQFYQRVRADGIRVSAVGFTLHSNLGGGFMGEFVVPLAQEIGPILGGAAISWLQGRPGRGVRLTMGELDINIVTLGEFDALLAQVRATKLGGVTSLTAVQPLHVSDKNMSQSAED